MVGITSWGAYIPLWRLSRSAITRGLKGERAIAGHDEDSITMAVGASMDCLKGADRQAIDGLFFASTTSPYSEKLCAALVATAVDLRRDIVTADFSNSLRAGSIALEAAVDSVKAGSAKQILVVASDCRMGTPGSVWEANCGDGAVAFLIGCENVIAEIDAYHSVCDEMLDVWRTLESPFIRSWESRFVSSEGYLRVCKEAIAGLMAKASLSQKSFSKLVIGVHDEKFQKSLPKVLGFDSEENVQDSLFASVGGTGAAYALMLLQASLEESREEDRILLVSYGNGADALSLKVKGPVSGGRSGLGLRGHLESKKTIEDYRTYLRWRELLPYERPSYFLGETSPPALWREVDQNIRLSGVKCTSCGTVQYPPQEICTKCHTQDKFEKVRLSDKIAKLWTYSSDHVSWTPDPPLITTIVNLEGGGRIQCLMAEAKEEELTIGMPLSMSFRKLDFREGIYVYSWKSVPVRA